MLIAKNDFGFLAGIAEICLVTHGIVHISAAY